MDDRKILDMVMEMLMKTHPTITVHTEFQQIGADSEVLLDIILDVEQMTGREFDPDAFSSELTPLTLSRAFKAPP
jgi:acyl carrier protein